MEYSAASVTISINGRTVLVVGYPRADLARAVAAEIANGTGATITAAADVIQLYAASSGSGFDRDLDELEDQLSRRPVFVEPPPLPHRARTRPRAPRSTPAARRLSWLVEGRGR